MEGLITENSSMEDKVKFLKECCFVDGNRAITYINGVRESFWIDKFLEGIRWKQKN